MSADEPKRSALGEGAAQAAPTAPHATPRGGEGAAGNRAGRSTARNGPERFWSKGPVRVAFAVGLGLSVLAHSPLVPLGLPSGFEMEDVEGEAAIPIDVLGPDTPAPALEEPAPAAAPPSPQGDDKSNAAAAALAKAHPDAGSARDAGEGERDGAAIADGAAFDGAGPLRDAAMIALGASDAAIGAEATEMDASPGGADPHALAGAVAAIQPKVVNVVLVINAEVIRKNPVGATMGYLLRGIPQWDDFMRGTTIDPVRDVDWFMVSGPSLVNSERDVVLIHYSAPDAVIERAVSVISHKYDRGGPFDAGVPGVKAVLAHADRAERVILRPQPHVLAVAPPADAAKVARQLAGSRVKAPVLPGEAVYLRLLTPHRPFPELPDSISELRLRVSPAADDGADVYLEGDTSDPGAAAQAADVVARIVRRHNDVFTSLLTHGLLDQVTVTSEGNLVKLHLRATRDQIETLVALVGSLLGLPPPGQAPTPSSAGTSLGAHRGPP